jgi:hypothetical protein
VPLRDHFRPPLDDQRHWEGFHATWPVMMVALLRQKLPRRYFAEPRVHSGSSAEIDVATFEGDSGSMPMAGNGNGSAGGIATAVWAPPHPTLAVATDLPTQDVYEVQVFDEKRQCRLVAAVEIVSPSNKDRPEHRRAFVAKCAGLLRERVSVVIIDIVTTRALNLYDELLSFLGHSDPKLSGQQMLYSAACRFTKRADEWWLETWAQPLVLGQPLPTVPLWLADNLAVPLELDACYEQSCNILNLP